MNTVHKPDSIGPSMVAAGIPFYSMSSNKLHLLGQQRSEDWERLLSWRERFEEGQAIYALPEKFFDVFGRRGYLSDELCEREKLFRKMCELNHTTGFLPDGLPTSARASYR